MPHGTQDDRLWIKPETTSQGGAFLWIGMETRKIDSPGNANYFPFRYQILLEIVPLAFTRSHNDCRAPRPSIGIAETIRYQNGFGIQGTMKSHQKTKPWPPVPYQGASKLTGSIMSM